MNTPEALRSHVSFARVNRSTIGLLKLIHYELLPVRYTDSLYDLLKEGTKSQGELAFLYGDTAIGEICYRVEDENDTKKLYIITIGVLPSYQRIGVGKMLFEHALQESEKSGPVQSACLHVNVENALGMAFWEALGFAKGELVHDHYPSLEHTDAYSYSKACH
jgi:ribosomal-protein-alanine N-acetyltransferase